MIIFYIALTATTLLAGVGLKCLIDRAWPQKIYIPQHVTAPEAKQGRTLDVDDTMDLLGSAYMAGTRVLAPAENSLIYRDGQPPQRLTGEYAETAWPEDNGHAAQ